MELFYHYAAVPVSVSVCASFKSFLLVVSTLCPDFIFGEGISVTNLPEAESIKTN